MSFLNSGWAGRAIVAQRIGRKREFRQGSHFTPRQLWQQVRAQVVLSARGYVLFDDTVLDKHHSRRIEPVRRQYSGNAHVVIVSIGLVTCVCVNPDTDQF